MKKIYSKPEIVYTAYKIETYLLADSVSDAGHGSKIDGGATTPGGKSSDPDGGGGAPDYGPGRAKQWTGDWELPEWWDDGQTVSEKLDF